MTIKQDSVLSEASGLVYKSTKGKVKSSNSVLSGPPKPGMSTPVNNIFACNAVHNKMAHSTHNGSNAKKLYTDTDPDSRTEIITDINVKKPAWAGNLLIEVKVDSSSKANCMPLHKFQTLFPYLCRGGMLKEGALHPSTAKFTGYGGTDVKSHGYLEIHAQNITTKKFHVLKFHVLDTESPRILMCPAAAHWIGLVKVLCVNKAPTIRRQVDSLTHSKDKSTTHNVSHSR